MVETMEIWLVVLYWKYKNLDFRQFLSFLTVEIKKNFFFAEHMEYLIKMWTDVSLWGKLTRWIGSKKIFSFSDFLVPLPKKLHNYFFHLNDPTNQLFGVVRLLSIKFEKNWYQKHTCRAKESRAIQFQSSHSATLFRKIWKAERGTSKNF